MTYLVTLEVRCEMLTGMGKLDTFRVLLDDPAAAPALGYDDYARLSDVIRHSCVRFLHLQLPARR